MRKIRMIMAGVIVFVLSSCGQTKNFEGGPADIISSTTGIGGENAVTKNMDYKALGIKN